MLRKALAAAILAALLSTPAAANPAMASGKAKSNQFWWPEQVHLGPLRDHVNPIRTVTTSTTPRLLRVLTSRR